MLEASWGLKKEKEQKEHLRREGGKKSRSRRSVGLREALTSTSSSGQWNTQRKAGFSTSQGLGPRTCLKLGMEPPPDTHNAVQVSSKEPDAECLPCHS